MKEGLISSIVVLCALIVCTHAVDSISANQTIRDGETIVSAQETFELGFFSPRDSTNRYVGIWYKKISTGTVVWVANRNTPLSNTSGELSLTLQGILVVRNVTGNIIWSSENSPVENPVSQLLDSGNFVIRDANSENSVWESFDYPTDTHLAGMKFGRDLVTGLDRNFTSWKSENDPAVGKFTVSIDTTGYPQLMLRDGSTIVYRAGPWNGLGFSGIPSLRPNSIYRFGFVLNQKEIYYHYELINASVVTRIVLKPNGATERLLWIDRTQEWSLYLTSDTDSCDRYALCGPHGSCNINNSPSCGCLEGFEPTSPDQWKATDWSRGCQRRTALSCAPGEGFKKYSNLKLPNTQRSWFDQNMNLRECERMCKNNCSCSAYTSQNITGGGSGCLLWFGDLIDIRTFSGTGQDLYIRMAASELDGGSWTVQKRVRIIVPLVCAVLVILVFVCLFVGKRRRKRKQEVQRLEMFGEVAEDFGHDPSNKGPQDDLELPMFGLSMLLKATNFFSDNNKLGEGGFGPVYKGVLEDGQEIAVKRLAMTSTQGLEEFKNEVISISKLQHRNLVKLLGCCIEGVEKMLIYEYMPNKGLDSFIFDKTRSKLLNWPTRFHIINGIARGLLYLHQDSRLRIIHRDLKVSNILLDSDMNPKISDFGMARSVGGNQIEANTNRVVGTYGYMAPEYAGDGIFSIKSDVFSFGVLVLEIVSGEKNRGFFHKEHSNNLLGHAWRLHKEGRSLEMVAESLAESVNMSEILRSIHVGLLCVQQRPEDRPNMSSVVLMLGSEGALPLPRQPGYFTEKPTSDTGYSSSTYGSTSTNRLSITMLEAR